MAGVWVKHGTYHRESTPDNGKSGQKLGSISATLSGPAFVAAQIDYLGKERKSAPGNRKVVDIGSTSIPSCAL